MTGRTATLPTIHRVLHGQLALCRASPPGLAESPLATQSSTRVKKLGGCQPGIAVRAAERELRVTGETASVRGRRPMEGASEKADAPARQETRRTLRSIPKSGGYDLSKDPEDNPHASTPKSFVNLVFRTKS